MPLDGRDFEELAFYVPGVSRQAPGGSGSNLSINGARTDNTNYNLDGFSNRELRKGKAQVRPPIDSVQEFKVQVSGYSAEYGRFAGGVVNMVLKSGSNRLHGIASEYMRNDLFDARNFFDAGKSKLRRNQFGGSLDGPVSIPKLYNGRDRTFFSRQLGELPAHPGHQPVGARIGGSGAPRRFHFLADHRRQTRRGQRPIDGQTFSGQSDSGQPLQPGFVPDSGYDPAAQSPGPSQQFSGQHQRHRRQRHVSVETGPSFRRRQQPHLPLHTVRQRLHGPVLRR